MPFYCGADATPILIIHLTKQIVSMQNLFALLMATLFICTAKAQNSFKIITKDNITKEPLIGVNIQLNKIGTSTNSKGFAELKNISNGLQAITFSYTGFKTITDSFSFPMTNTDTVEVLMEI